MYRSAIYSAGLCAAMVISAAAMAAETRSSTKLPGTYYDQGSYVPAFPGDTIGPEVQGRAFVPDVQRSQRDMAYRSTAKPMPGGSRSSARLPETFYDQGNYVPAFPGDSIKP